MRSFQNFLMHFSYLSKLRFIIICSYLPLIGLVYAIPYLFNPPIRDLNCKIEALETLEQANDSDLKILSFQPNRQVLEKVAAQFQTLRQEAPLSCSFTLEMRDNGARRLLQATNWDLPESRTHLTHLLTSVLYSDPEKAPSQTLMTSVAHSQKRLVDHANRVIEQLELAYRANESLHPFHEEAQNWRDEILALEPDLSKTGNFEQKGFRALKSTIELQKILYGQLLELLKKQLQAFKWMRLISFLFLGVGGLLGILFYTNRGIRHPLSELIPALKQIQKGIYKQIVPPKQEELREIAFSLNSLGEFLENFWKEMQQILAKLKNTFSTVLQTAKNLEENIDSQVTTARQISSASRFLLSSVQNLEDELIIASRSAASTGEIAATGNEGLKQMDSIMQGMLTASSNIVSTLSILQEEVGIINKVIDTIVKIADQSNLLSLNTAIRANKTGIQGKGFTVIADRIREMADQIAKATLDIEMSVQDIVKAVLEADQGIEHFSGQIRQHVQDTNEIASQLKQLIDDTQSQIERFERIKEAMQLQMQQITSVAAITGEIKKEATSSHNLAGKLHREMHQLSLTSTWDRGI